MSRNGEVATRSDNGLQVLAALIGNKQHEVGLAAMNLELPILDVAQVSDDRKYSATLAALQQLKCSRVLIPASHDRGSLANALARSRLFQITRIQRSAFSEDRGLEALHKLGIGGVGVEAGGISSKAIAISAPYLGRAAVAALLRTIEAEQEACFMKGSLRIKIGDMLKDRLVMDSATLRNLELLTDSREVLAAAASGSSVKSRSRQSSMLRLLDKTVTKPGNRQLRSDLASPPAKLDAVLLRQDLVACLASEERMQLCEELRTMLSQCHDVDSLACHFAVRPKAYNVRTLKREADNALRVREVLRLLNPLSDLLRAIDSRESKLAETLCSTLVVSREALEPVAIMLSELLAEDGQFRPNAEEQRVEAIFAIKPDLDGLLDVARVKYHDTIGEMKEYVGRLNKCFPEVQATLAYSGRRGYHIRIPLQRGAQKRSRTSSSTSCVGTIKCPDGQHLPATFIRRAKFRTKIECSTEEMERLNSLQEQAAAEALKRTEIKLLGLRDAVKSRLVHLFAAADAIALLDVLQCYANFSSNFDPDVADFPCLTRPKFFQLDLPVQCSLDKSDQVARVDDESVTCASEPTDGNSCMEFDLGCDGPSSNETKTRVKSDRLDGLDRQRDSDKNCPEKDPFYIRKGRHLLVECAMNASDSDMQFVPNDLSFETGRQCKFIFGPNCAGKSTYLKSVALICILAQLGCFVPAQEASLPIIDRIYTRMGNDDNLEANASTFSLEMCETAYILASKPRENLHQLVLIDELGRGTATNEGFAIAWAVSEALQNYARTYTLFATHFSQLEHQINSTCSHFGARIDHNNHELVQTYCLSQKQVGLEAAPTLASSSDSSSADALRVSSIQPVDSAQIEGTKDDRQEQEEYEADIGQYGLFHAKMSGFSPDVLKLARTTRAKLCDQAQMAKARHMRLNVLVRDIDTMSMRDVRDSLVAIQAALK